MKRKRYTAEENIRILREADVTGSTIQDVCRERKITGQTFHRWEREFGMLEVDQAKQLKELKKENARLKKMLAEFQKVLFLVFIHPIFQKHQRLHSLDV